MNGKRPKGCDDQGRFPEAAEACSDILIDEDERDRYRYRYRSGGKEMAGLEWFIWAIVLGIVLLVVILTMMGVPV